MRRSTYLIDFDHTAVILQRERFGRPSGQPIRISFEVLKSAPALAYNSASVVDVLRGACSRAHQFRGSAVIRQGFGPVSTAIIGRLAGFTERDDWRLYLLTNAPREAAPAETDRAWKIAHARLEREQERVAFLSKMNR